MSTTKERARIDAEAAVGRLRTVVEALQGADENERRATIYYAIAKLYGNAAGDEVLATLKRHD